MPDCIAVRQVSTAPLPPQLPIPPGTHDWILSFDLQRAWMKIRRWEEGKPLEDMDTWWFKKMVGKMRVTGTDDATGRVYLRCRAQIQGDTCYFYRPVVTPNGSVTPNGRNGHA